MKLVKLPSGNYINLDMAYKIEFDIIPDVTGVPHQKCKLIWDNYTSDFYSDNDAIFIKDYLDKNHGGFFPVHELDHAVQVIGLGCAVQVISNISGKPPEEISETIIRMANETVVKLTPQQITAIREDYENNHGNGEAGILGFIPLNKDEKADNFTA